MATKETVYEAIVALRAESTALRTDLTKASATLESSLTSMGALAQRLAPVLTIGGIVAFGKSLVDLGGELTDLSAQTGFAAQTLSGIKSTLEENGTSLDTFARGIFIAQKNLGGIDEESDKAAQAIGRLGLNVDELKNASPEEFLKLVGTAMAGIVNPTERAAVGAQIFGKSWQELAPVIGEVAANLDELKKSGLSEHDIATLEAAGDAWTRFSNRVKVAAASAIIAIVDYHTATGHGSLLGGAADVLKTSGVKSPVAAAPVVETAAAKKAAAELSKAYQQLNDVGLTPLGKTIAGINAQFVTLHATAAAAYKGDELTAYNAKLDDQQAKLIAITQQQAGKTAVGKFESNFGVKFGFTNKSAGQDLAQSFVGVFNTMKDDKANQGALNQAFGSFVKQALAMGLPDIPELLSSVGLSGANLSRLTADLPSALQTAVDATIAVGQQWREGMAAETAAVNEQFKAVGVGIDTVSAALDAMIGKAAQKMALDIDTSAAELSIFHLRDAIYSIPDVTTKYIQFVTLGQASPVMPFAQFVPHLKGQLDSITENRTADIVYNAATAGGNSVGAQSNAPGAAGGVTVNIDLSGASLSQEFLDAQLVPKIAKGISLATGKDAGFRVLS